jgi:hypothetical protein
MESLAFELDNSCRTRTPSSHKLHRNTHQLDHLNLVECSGKSKIFGKFKEIRHV